MKIQHQQTEQQGEFFILDEQGKKIAELTYFFVDPQTINANHTYVSEVLRGKGIADKLYQALSEFIQAKKLNLIPSCSYIARKWEREQGK
ncbi:GNAT family N-acetyltransferase [Pasteurella sp. PK-2025]|uniref:GNAT family N-acetyltransferase n=1 Tax=unclassified Pasteurella TaxID=2621516 RepID=UPI003C75AFF9